jgi:SH3-like domain-containing protein
VQKGSITVVSAVALSFFLSACKPGPPRGVPIAEAFVGPAVLKIRSDLPPQSSTVAVVKHGDRLEILQARRKVLRVRTPNGAEGWADERQLLGASDMASLRELAQRAAKMPSQGLASTYAPLNVHTQPSLGSPSFLQVKENEKVAVLRSVMLPRSGAAPRQPLVPPPPKKVKAAPKAKPAKKTSKIPPPPLPKPPPLPADWLELSKSDQAEAVAAAEATAEPVPQKMDGWSLVRTAEGQSGWALTRLLTMAIPDDVAQYAEGKRIVSYFPLGEVQDGEEKKTVWLWTTTTDSRAPWDFDSLRVFTWSLRRHRYETAYIERSMKGYWPVLPKQVALSGKGVAGTYSGFSVCEEKKDGGRYRREYAWTGTSVRFAGEQPCEPPSPPLEVRNPAPVTGGETAAPPPKTGVLESIKKRWKELRGK